MANLLLWIKLTPLVSEIFFPLWTQPGDESGKTSRRSAAALVVGRRAGRAPRVGLHVARFLPRAGGLLRQKAKDVLLKVSSEIMEHLHRIHFFLVWTSPGK